MDTVLAMPASQSLFRWATRTYDGAIAATVSTEAYRALAIHAARRCMQVDELVATTHTDLVRRDTQP